MTQVGFKDVHDSATGKIVRRPSYVSPGQNTFTFLVDGQTAYAFNQTTGVGGPVTTSNGSTISFSGETSGNDYIITLTVDTTPGTHLIGAVVQGNAPAYVLSEGQHSYTLAPGANTNLVPLALTGVMGTAYIECATVAQILADITAGTDNCGGYQNFNQTTGQYTFTAIAADADGFPIVAQNSPYGPGNVRFDNGGYTAVETTSPAILTVSNMGPYIDPGVALTGPSGGFYVPGQFTYGNQFNIACNKVGQGTVGLQITQNAPSNPVTGFTIAPGTYPGAGIPRPAIRLRAIRTTTTATIRTP
ncbi:MAG: hypothetical protein ABI282_08105 [Candidatus Baltobacteraceae bacterium]